MKLVLDSGGVSYLAAGTGDSAAFLVRLHGAGLWPPVVPAPVLIECLSGRSGPDARTNRLLKTCDIVTELPVDLARRCAELRTRAGRGSAVDALVVGVAEPDGTVLTSDPKDLRALAREATGVQIVVV